MVNLYCCFRTVILHEQQCHICFIIIHNNGTLLKTFFLCKNVTSLSLESVCFKAKSDVSHMILWTYALSYHTRQMAP